MVGNNRYSITVVKFVLAEEDVRRRSGAPFIFVDLRNLENVGKIVIEHSY